MAENMGAIIKRLRLEKGITQDELAKVVGLQRSAIAKYELGIVDNMKQTTIKLMADFFNVKPSYLMGFEEEQPKNILKDLLMIPVVGKIRAGEPILAEENIEDNFWIPKKMHNLTSNEGIFYLRVIGNSMNNIVKEGGFALIKQQDYAESGDIVVAIVNGDNEATLKRFKYLDNEFIMLEPDSTDDNYKPLIINLRDTDFKILGKLIGIYQIWN